jgi:IclR family acetate operon transcriptional repressor
MAVNRLGTLQRGLDVLELVARRQPIAGAEIARELNVERSALQRVLVTLADTGWLRQAAHERTWEIGIHALHVMHTSWESHLALRARPVLEALRDETGETAFLALGGGGRMVVVEVAESRQLARIVPRVALKIDAEFSAVVLAATAFAPLEEQHRLAARSDDPDRLARELSDTRARGWSRSVDVVQDGVAGLAARVLDRSGRPAGAISLCCPTDRLTAERQTVFGELVAGAALTLSEVQRSR